MGLISGVSVTVGLGIGMAAVAMCVSGILSGGPHMFSKVDRAGSVRSDEYPFFPKSPNTCPLPNLNILGVDSGYLFGDLA